MLFLSVLGLVLATAAAMEINFNTRAAHRLLETSTLIEGRYLNENNQVDNAIAALVLRYTGCVTSYYLSGEGNNQNNENSPLIASDIIKFELAESCGGEPIGRYATSMANFVDSYTESKLEEDEWNCENFREACACDDADDAETCYTTCFTNGVDANGNSMASCIQEDNEDFELQKYLECQKMNNNNNNNNNNNQNGDNGDENAPYNWKGKYYVGPYCANDGYSILLGMFYDERCSTAATSSKYEELTGVALPYSTESILPKNVCVKCNDEVRQAENNNNNNNNNNNQNGNNNYWYNMQPKEFCVQSYQASVRCEKEENGYFYYSTTMYCDFIDKYLDNITPKALSLGTASTKKTAMVFAWVFGFTTLLFGAYAYFLYRKIKRGSGGLASQEGGAIA